MIDIAEGIETKEEARALIILLLAEAEKCRLDKEHYETLAQMIAERFGMTINDIEVLRAISKKYVRYI